jgi:hypothetical protein
MSKPKASPTRLSRLPESEDALGVGRMFREARELPDEDLPTLRWRLRTSQRLRALRPRLLLRAALVVGSVFFMGGVVGAAVAPFLARKPSSAVEAAPPPGAAPTPKRRKARRAAPAPIPAVPEEAMPVAPEPEPAPDLPKPAPVRTKHRASVHVAMVSEPAPLPAPSGPPEEAPAPVAPSAIAVEQTLLSRAMRTMRDSDDARTALALLAQHAEQFPEGALIPEATMLRIEALLALGRRGEALSVLDRAKIASLPNRDEQLVVRGELRAAKGRWREAKQDFDRALRDGRMPAASARARDLQERALWGRAAARSRLGDQDGARADLSLYLRHFPGGQFARSATSLVKGAP